MPADRAIMPSGLLTNLFPPGVIAMETRVPGDPASLSIAEAEHIRRAKPKRASEFAAGRLCARRVLEQLGRPGWDLLVNQDRTAIWPGNIVGSISHTMGFCGAIAGERHLFGAIGFDVEVASRVSSDLYGQFCTAGELKFLTALPRPIANLQATLLFSAKEAFYKCQYPVTRQWLDFEDIAVVFHAETAQKGSFTISPCRTLELEERYRPPWQGRFAFSEGFVVAGIALLVADERSEMAIDQDGNPDDDTPADDRRDEDADDHTPSDDLLL